MEKQTEIEIDLWSLLLRLKSKIWVILLVTVIFVLGGYVGSKLFSTPVYTATTQVYVFQANEDGVDSSNISVATQVLRDCALIIRGESVAQEVIAQLGLKTTTANLINGIKVTADQNTRILNLHFTGGDPEQAALIINTVREVAAEKIWKLMDMHVLRTVYEASVPETASNINTKRTALISGAVGLALSLVVLVTVFLLDDTIRTEDDVQNYLGLSTLAVIPVSDDLFVARGSKKSSGKRKLAGAERSGG